MPNIKQLKTKIQSTKGIKKITNAMEIISTIKLQKTKKQTEWLREYTNSFLDIIADISHIDNIFPKPSHSSNQQLAILISSDKWLCGSLNTNIFKKFNQDFADKRDILTVFAIGKKSYEFCNKNWYNVWNYINLSDNFTESDLHILYQYISDNTQNFANIYIYYNYFKNIIKQIPTRFQLHPMNIDNFEQFAQELQIEWFWKDTKNKNLWADIWYEPGKAPIIQKIYKIINEVIIYWCILQNKTWEFASRMLAMKWAKDNATNIVDNLTSEYNKARQEAITKEVLEIVSAKAVIEN